MTTSSAHRILLITDDPTPSADILAILRERAESGPVQLRVLMTNPARAEAHLVHGERHAQLPAAKLALDGQLAQYRQATGSEVTGAVSIRHDAFDAVEEDLVGTEADEIVIGEHRDSELSRRLHHDLAHRLEHLHRTVTSVRQHTPTA